MNIETIISSAVVSAAIAGIISIIVALISKRSAEKVAEETTHREIEKMKQTWIHDDKVLRDEAFNGMIASVTRYIHDSSRSKQEEARVKTALVLSSVDGELADRIVALDNSLKCRPPHNVEDLLKDVLSCKQEIDTRETASS